MPDAETQSPFLFLVAHKAQELIKARKAQSILEAEVMTWQQTEDELIAWYAYDVPTFEEGQPS